MSVFATKPLKNTKVEPCQCYHWQFFREEPHSKVGLEMEVHLMSLTLVSYCCIQMEALQSFDISWFLLQLLCTALTLSEYFLNIFQ